MQRRAGWTILRAEMTRSPTVERLPDAATFLAIAGAVLGEREVEHNLLLGIAGDCVAEPARSRSSNAKSLTPGPAA